jgi:uncharacterized protein YciI
MECQPLKMRVTVLVAVSIATALKLSAQNATAPQASTPATTTQQSVAGLDTSRMLRKKFWIIETRGVPGANATPEMMRKHLERQKELEKAGILFAAGPVMGGEAPYGMIVVRADSREAAQKIADGDPLHVAKIRSYVLREWQINEGRVSIKLNFSDGSYAFE